MLLFYNVSTDTVLRVVILKSGAGSFTPPDWLGSCMWPEVVLYFGFGHVCSTLCFISRFVSKRRAVASAAMTSSWLRLKLLAPVSPQLAEVSGRWKLRHREHERVTGQTGALLAACDVDTAAGDSYGSFWGNSASSFMSLPFINKEADSVFVKSGEEVRSPKLSL